MKNFEIVFESDRIYFINLSENLVNDYLIMVNDKDVQKYISKTSKTYTLEEELEWIKSKLSENAIIFSMIEKDTLEYIGNIEIMDIVDNVGVMGIAITPKKQNQKFGSEAIKGIINYAFKILNLDYLDLNVYDFNKRAIHCYEKVGFKKVGVGKAIDEIHMRITK